MRAVLLMAHGAPRSLDEVEEYVLRIRRGRPMEPAQMAEIVDRYRQIGGSPLLEWTRKQAEALAQRLRQAGVADKVYIGMKHSSPFIHETVTLMRSEGVSEIFTICLAPQFSQLTIGAYRKELEEAFGQNPMATTLTASYAKHPGLIRAFSAKLNEARSVHPEAFVIFTAHSLPARVLAEADPYDFEVKETARLVALEAKLPDWRFAYQSQGMTSEHWLGPTVETRLEELAARNVREVLIAPIGFVCDHVEILYDIDIYFRQIAEKLGIRLIRTPSLNDSPEFIDLLFTLATTAPATPR